MKFSPDFSFGEQIWTIFTKLYNYLSIHQT